ncbi:MAG: M48 family metallopeptidase [Bacteroidales bacterium]|nr:M48 family metallopeptidase [Bacteroidales bacterium]
MNIDYKLIYSKRKTLNISVERDRSIIVRAPINTSKEKIDEIIEKKKLWLFEKINHGKKYPEHKNQKEFVSGETLLYLGKNYKLNIIEEDIKGIEFNYNFSISKKNQNKAYKLFKEWYKEKAKAKINKIAKEFSEHIGVKYNKIFISDIKYRWGSCTPKNNLNFNWRLIKAPMYVIKYIVIHELTHLIEPNHTPEFWNIVSIQHPDYEKAKNWLKENGELLEIDL